MAVTHVKGDTGLFIEVDLSDNSPRFCFHIKNTPTVWRSVQIHSVANQTGRSTLEEGERRARTISMQ